MGEETVEPRQTESGAATGGVLATLGYPCLTPSNIPCVTMVLRTPLSQILPGGAALDYRSAHGTAVEPLLSHFGGVL